MKAFKNESNNNRRSNYKSSVYTALIMVATTFVFTPYGAESATSTIANRLTYVRVSHESNADQDNKIFENPDILATPKDGKVTYSKYIGNNIKFSKQMLEAKLKGTVRVSFVVEKDGSLTNVKTLNDLGYGTSAEVIRVIKEGNKWQSAFEKERAVRSRVIFPIEFANSRAYHLVAIEGQKPIDAIQETPAIKEKTKEPVSVVLVDINDVSDLSAPRHVVASGPILKAVKESEIKNNDATIFRNVDNLPEPPGGMQKFVEYIGANYEYPEKALDIGVKGVMEITFVVERDGSLTDIMAKRDLGYGTGLAAVNLLKKSKKWKPGIKDGQIVRTLYLLPIRLNTND